MAFMCKNSMLMEICHIRLGQLLQQGMPVQIANKMEDGSFRTGG